MMDFLQHLTFEIKLIAASVIGGAALLADLANEYRGWEDVGLKGILIAAVVFIGRLYLKQQEEHRQERKADWEAHKKDREAAELAYRQAMETNSELLKEIKAATEEQTTYFKTVTRNLVEQHLKAPESKPKLP
jgi:hypothetical protein